MRILLPLLLALCIGAKAPAQTITKVYGFWNSFIPGNIPVAPPEYGKGDTITYDQSITYHIFIESSSAKAPVVKSVNIKGAECSTRLVKQPVPATYTYNDGQQLRKITMVPKNRKNVYIVVIMDIIRQAGKRATTNELVITYLDKGRKKTAVLKKMTELPVSITQ